MIKKMKLNYFSIVALLFLTINSAAVNAEFYPNTGGFYYNGRLYAAAYMKWNSQGPWVSNEPGYEHDLKVHEINYFTSSCTTFTNLPDGYDDCPTAGCCDQNGIVFSFGSFDAELIQTNTWYSGGWYFNYHFPGTAESSMTLIGQENESHCPGGYENIWCMFANDSQTLLEGYTMHWLGAPNWIYY